jgi:aconitate hydratase
LNICLIFFIGLEKGIKFPSQFTVTPGTETIRATLERDGILQTLESAGATVLSNACGPCIGQWKREVPEGEENKANSILCSFNRNFAGRNDGNIKTHSFLASPEIVTAMTLSGRLLFNPLTDTIKDSNGQEFVLKSPHGSDLPPNGFASGREEFLVLKNNEDDEHTNLEIPENSPRLQKLEPWPANTDSVLEDMPILIKAFGKCTTDHISPAGKWLKYKGHLENISECTLIGAVNAEDGSINSVTCALDGQKGSVPDVAKKYKSAGVPWVVIADHNYGEGSAREHAAMQPRFLGARAIIARSFARIHETNLKKQGVLPLTFQDPLDYDRVDSRARISIFGLDTLSPGKPVRIQVKTANDCFDLHVNHSMSEEQIQWYRAGGSLNCATQR